jgi:hypothetical protein
MLDCERCTLTHSSGLAVLALGLALGLGLGLAAMKAVSDAEAGPEAEV